MSENKILKFDLQSIVTQQYPISNPDINGPEYKEYVYQCSAIPPVIVQKTTDSEYKKFKVLECSPFVNVFNEFFINRQFSSYSYSPIITAIINLKNIDKILNFINRYFSHLESSSEKIEFTLDKPDINFDIFDKRKIYTVSMSNNFKNLCNIYIDEELPDFTKNEYLLRLKEKVGALLIIYDTETDSTREIFINSFIRTYADMIFFDKIDKKIYDTFSYIGCKANIKIDINDYLLCLDRTVLWSEFKSF